MAAIVGGPEETNSAASAVVMCSITILRSGRVCTRGVSTLWMNTFSLSKKSILGSVTSPCTSSNIPSLAICFKEGRHFFQSVTPESLLVVAPAGYNLNATTPACFAATTSSGVVLSVRYTVIRGVKLVAVVLLLFWGLIIAASIRDLYSKAAAAVVTGGTRLGMMTALAKVEAV